VREEQTASGPSARATALGILALTLFAAALRLYRLADPSLLADELFQIRSALSFGDLMITKSLGYLPTLIGLQLAGVDLAGLAPEAYAEFQERGMHAWNMRIGTTVVGILTVPLLAWASLDFLGRRGALLLALLLAAVPWHVEWSQHARFYTPTFLLFNLSAALYLSGTLRASQGRVAAAMVFAVLAVLCTPTSMMLFGLFALDGAYHWLRTRRLPVDAKGLAWVAGGIAVCVGSFAYDALTATETLGEFLARTTGLAPHRVGLENVYRSGLPLVLLAGLSALGLARQWPRIVFYLAMLAAVPILAFTALAPFSHVEDRYTFVNLYGWVALAAGGLGVIWAAMRARGSLSLAAAPVAVLLAVMMVENLYYFQSAYGKRARFAPAFALVERYRAPQEPVYTLNVWGGRFYLRDPGVQAILGDFPGLEALAAEGRSAWLVVKSTDAEIRGVPHWLDGHADMLGAFPTRYPHPQTTLRVYHFRPPGSEVPAHRPGRGAMGRGTAAQDEG
jgi:mannosyltransferase